MNFKLVLASESSGSVLPFNYSYPLSAAIYKIIQKGDAEYAAFLHEAGYGKGFKFFTFSQIRCPFKVVGDRMHLQQSELSFQVAFHLPEAMEHFIKGLFQSEEMVIADKRSRAAFTVKSVESLPDGLSANGDREIVSIRLKPLSPLVVGRPNEQGNYDYLSPPEPRFAESLLHNWRNKLATCYTEQAAKEALLMLEPVLLKAPPKSRLVTIKADTPQETRIRGWMHFGLQVTAEARFVKLLLNAGAGLYNAQGMGYMAVAPHN